MFSASRISELLAGGEGKTRNKYILDLAMQEIGIENDFDTKEMRHGTINQINSFEQIIKPKYKSAKWLDVFIPINEYCGASPDAVIFENIPVDMKCPYYIDTYIEQIKTLPKKYFYQSQMQMMAMKSEFGLMCFFLTKPDNSAIETWSEYPFELKFRNFTYEIPKDNQACDDILKAVELAIPVKKTLYELLCDADVLSEDEYFYRQLEEYKFRELKDANNILNVEQCFRVGNKFYYLRK